MEPYMITCPTCSTQIPLQETFAAQYVEAEKQKIHEQYRLRIEAIETREEQLASKRSEIAALEQQLAADRTDIDARAQQEVEAQKAAIAATEKDRASKALAQKFAALEDQLTTKNTKLAELEQNEILLRKERAGLEDEKRALELSVARRLDEERAQIRIATQREADEEFRLRMADKDRVIDDMKKQIDEARRKGEQGSQQLQGDVAEVDLLDVLSFAFKSDVIERVPKGQHGGDLIQQVVVAGNLPPMRIIIDSKRTRNWNEDWITKIRDDQRAANAEVAIIVSTTLPKDVETFALRDGVWVTSAVYAMNLVAALRWMLTQTASARLALQKRDTTMEAVYSYLTGEGFKQRISAIVETMITMQTDLEAEKRSFDRSYAKRRKLLERLSFATTGIYGDLQGIAGASLPQVDGLEVSLLSAVDETTDEELAS